PLIFALLKGYDEVKPSLTQQSNSGPFTLTPDNEDANMILYHLRLRSIQKLTEKYTRLGRAWIRSPTWVLVLKCGPASQVRAAVSAY
ncbi:hypothetical protein, partial [Asticcacaulis taihuensis]